ncbi:mechanosensitive ion channel family protein [Persicirhabdus sediminis]|uniref:Mechanosensitive ion channel n=1 Tax=Persicirhabdus sediminis TaxID=454144 RepID=A0A8J7MF52_9BACT|nr:mechanosensitive ion channel domain-containing protein [Persicirhabdus sediminis]MBK1791543.1 mechanosensitive ion channel [Persicirhabdus sediminis]
MFVLNNILASADERGLKFYLVEFLAAGIATVVFVFAYLVLRFCFRKLNLDDQKFFKWPLKDWKIQKQVVMSASELQHVLKVVATWSYRLVLLLMFLFYLAVLLTEFPQTRKYPLAIAAYIKKTIIQLGRDFVTYLPDLGFVLIIAAITWFVIRVVRLLFEGVARGRVQIRGFYPDWAKPTFVLVRILIVVFALVVIFPYLPGADSPALKGLSLFLGLLVSLGSTSAIAHIIGGIALTYMRAFKDGDRVRIADTEGDVVEKSLLVTRIRTPKNVEISIPNSMVMNNHIVNYSTHAKVNGLILHAEVTIGYDVPWRQVHELLIASARAVDDVDVEKDPFVLQKSLDDFSVRYEINLYTRRPRQTAKILSQLSQQVQDKFAEAGVEIMSPTFSALRDGNALTLPADALPQDYQPGGFSIKSILGK